MLGGLLEGVRQLQQAPLAPVPADNLDFVRFSQDFTIIKEKIMEKLAGREKVYF